VLKQNKKTKNTRKHQIQVCTHDSYIKVYFLKGSHVFRQRPRPSNLLIIPSVWMTIREFERR